MLRRAFRGDLYYIQKSAVGCQLNTPTCHVTSIQETNNSLAALSLQLVSIELNALYTLCKDWIACANVVSFTLSWTVPVWDHIADA